ncbi:TRAP transporter small permease [Algoriphagus hitonicola]|uniref:TRAP-type C4-dicarboxylate transport system, small permease component n=1 Tax=Algoriphagus hitonicola TaxID=435880 RepID=A0A1I2WEZ7_9BACT|nr:TRAP transporter small permease [Algoriphagus hitonicola]SFG99227.1 TRAP-type C4-dicarboxylate transport system, small permease component [Algoriphagus hitonicola]
METLQKNSTFRKKADWLISWVLVWLMSLMVINVSWQVASRYLLNDPSSFTDELARYMLIWIGMLGAAYVAGKNEHLAIDVLQDFLQPDQKRRVQVFIRVIIGVFALLTMVIGGSNLVYITFILEQTSAALRIPLAYVYGIIPVSGLLVIYYQVSDILLLQKTKIQTTDGND